MKIKVNNVFLATAVLICVIAGVLFGALNFGVLNIVCSEIVLLPSLVLLMAVDIENERVSTLIKTISGSVLLVALVANVLMGIFHAGILAYTIVDGLLLIALLAGSYSMTRLNQ